MCRPLLIPGGMIRAIGFIALVLIVAAISMLLGRAPEETSILSHSPLPQTDPLARELARCNALGLGGEDEPACKDAWAENRRRFFTYRPSDQSVFNPVDNQPSNTPVEDK